MENSNSANNQQDNIQTKKPGFFSSWINSLLGKPTPKYDTQAEVSKEESVTQKSTEPDSVTEDIAHFKDFMHKAGEKMQPLVDKGKQGSSSALSSATKVVDVGLVRKLVSILLIILFLGVAGFLVSRIYKNIEVSNGGGGDVVVVEGPTPTTGVYLPDNPSVWAEDPQVLQIEEELNTLHREVTNTLLKEPSLNLPILDFNVSF